MGKSPEIKFKGKASGFLNQQRNLDEPKVGTMSELNKRTIGSFANLSAQRHAFRKTAGMNNVTS